MEKDSSCFDVWKIRRDFPILHKKINGYPLVYLDSAATAQKPDAVIHALRRYYEEECGTVHRAIYDLSIEATEAYTATRRKVQRFIRAQREEEIIFTSGTTTAINLLAIGLGKERIEAGDEIIISAMEHHSNLIPWQLLCREKGAKLRIIPVDNRGDIILEEYAKILSKRTKVVSIAHMGNVTGTINPVKKIISMAHDFGAKVILDGAQAVCQLPIDVVDLDVDFYLFSSHKLYGPTGLGILYGKRECLEMIPPPFGGSDMIDKVSFESMTFQPLPLRWETGTPPIAAVIAFGAAIDYLESIGKEAIFSWKNRLLAYATKKLIALPGLRIIGDAKEKGGIISFTMETLHPLDLATILNLKGIAIRTGHLCAQPLLHFFGVSSLSRISFGMYTTEEEIDTFTEVLQEASLLLQK